MSEKISTVEFPIPYKRAGNVITQQNVSFDFFREAGYYKLIPLLSKEELLVANLPEELLFEIRDGKPVSLRGKKDGNFHVIEDAVKLLKKNHLL